MKKCNSCNNVVNLLKRNTVWKLPPIVLIYFQRCWKGNKSYAAIDIIDLIWDPWDLVEGTDKITGLYYFACGIFYGEHGYYSITLNRITNKFYKHENNDI
jgi:hypothetical protein